MCFIGYSKNPKGYRLIDLSTEKVVTRRDVLYNETDFRFFIGENKTVSILLSEYEKSGGKPQSEEAPQIRRAVHRPAYVSLLTQP